jgi:hypothetical protein
MESKALSRRRGRGFMVKGRAGVWVRKNETTNEDWGFLIVE